MKAVLTLMLIAVLAPPAAAAPACEAGIAAWPLRAGDGLDRELKGVLWNKDGKEDEEKNPEDDCE